MDLVLRSGKTAASTLENGLRTREVASVNLRTLLVMFMKALGKTIKLKVKAQCSIGTVVFTLVNGLMASKKEKARKSGLTERATRALIGMG